MSNKLQTTQKRDNTERVGVATQRLLNVYCVDTFNTAAINFVGRGATTRVLMRFAFIRPTMRLAYSSALLLHVAGEIDSK